MIRSYASPSARVQGCALAVLVLGACAMLRVDGDQDPKASFSAAGRSMPSWRDFHRSEFTPSNAGGDKP